MTRRTTLIAGGVLALALVVAGAGMALAGGADDDAPLSGTDLERASQAALEHTGGGTVIETEVGDDGAAYGVVVRLDDGSVVEVQLDDNFNVTADETDDDGAEGDDAGSNDD
jgi:Peptidase propeptide and YPEB domain